MPQSSFLKTFRFHHMILTINLPPVSNRKGQDDQFPVLHQADQPVSSYPVSPLSFSIGSQTLAIEPGILTVHEMFLDPGFDHLLGVTIEPFKLLFKSGGRFH